MLRPLIDRKSLVVLGLNSGTSADGLDMAVLQITRQARRVQAQFLSGRTAKYPEGIRELVLRAADTHDIPINEIIRLDNLLGQFYGRSAHAFISNLGRRGKIVDAVASHGQTVRHLPRPQKIAGKTVRGTLQLGSLAHIAAWTGKVTIGDFRQGDIALGGEGAPITVSAMGDLFSDRTEPRLIVNVGGMSNYFLLPAGAGSAGEVRAADCGPGNVLSDLLCQRLFGQPYDHNGRHAARGVVSRRLLAVLLASPFFSGRQRSTGREEFGEPLVKQMIACGRTMNLSPDDVVATAMELTAVSIAKAVGPYVSPKKGRVDKVGRVGRLYLTGGGAHNRFLCARLSERLDGLPVSTVGDLGMDPDLVEASAYAVMGASTLWSRPLATGNDGRRHRFQPVLGMICQPPQAVLVKD